MHYLKKISIGIVLVALAFSYTGVAFAAGNINPALSYSQFLDKDIDNNGTYDFINWNPDKGGATVGDSSVTGYIWGETVGWINLGPFTNAGASAGIKNTCAGDLSGYAWGQNAGWINFAPTYATGANEPRINPSTGDITGSVWSQNYGWITLNSGDGTYPGLNTTWRPSPDCSDQVDVCPGVPGIQISTSECPPPPGGGIDICSNVEGIQASVPDGHYKIPATPGVPGECFPDPTDPPNPNDMCPGVPGIQISISECPPPPPPDVCPGTPGIQISITECPPPPPPDVCPGTPGIQISITECPPPPPPDVCPAVPGIQISITECPDSFQGDSKAVNGGTSTLAFLADPLEFLKTSNVGWVLPIIGIIAGIPGLITRFGNLMLTFVFRRKKMRGIVYDSVTKEPLDPAYISVIDLSTNQEVTTAITDMDGRYGFVLKKGTYKIVANKTHYQFPSQLLNGRIVDEVYDHLYFGEPFTVENEEEVVTKNIPMDQTGEDWNQQEKRRMSPLKYLIENQKVWGTICDVLFVLGFIFSIITTYYYPVWWNVAMIFLYVAIGLLHFFGFGPVAPGKITRAGAGVPFAIIRVFNVALNREVAHKVTTQLGGYYILVPKANYYITVEQRNPDGGYTKVFTSTVMHADQGIINKSFEI